MTYDSLNAADARLIHIIHYATFDQIKNNTQARTLAIDFDMGSSRHALIRCQNTRSDLLL